MVHHLHRPILVHPPAHLTHPRTSPSLNPSSTSPSSPCTAVRQQETLRLGIVPYFNVLPLIEGLEADFPANQWRRATPRELAGMLAAGELDVAIVSSIAGLEAGWQFVPGAAITSDGPVRSVALYSKVPLGNIRSVLFDRASLTSLRLAEILWRPLLGIDPQKRLHEAPIGPDFRWKEAPQDAFVVIGDTALHWEHAFPYKLDLGEGWQRLTGLPFVYALWWVRPGLELTPEQRAAFVRARERGEAAAQHIAARVSRDHPDFPGGQASLHHYLSEAIRYRLGGRELRGLRNYEERKVKSEE